jgi:DNA polymerase I-like protein with 3'-5' exonuclease and polymerase domains
MRHRTVVNVPSVEATFGKEMRELFEAAEGYDFVGHDASGLENRMLAHYMNDPDLSHEILDGDFHTKVWETIDEYVHSRKHTKNTEYALFYGASDAKLGRMCDYKPPGMSMSALGEVVRDSIMKGLPALGRLNAEVLRSCKRGYLVGLDGRKLWVRSPHSALNLLLQSAGAIVMKMSMIYLDAWVCEAGLDVRKVIDMHDEAQAEVKPEHTKKYMELATRSVVKAGEFFKLNVPLDAEAMAGKDWGSTH